MGHRREMVDGDPDKAFETADNVVEGEVRVGGQEHFYLETMATLAIPRGEDGEMEIYCSSQHLAEGQVKQGYQYEYEGQNDRI